MYKRIMVPLDGSQRAEAAVPLACSLARTSGAEIVFVQVVEYPFESGSQYETYPAFIPRPQDEPSSARRRLFAAVNSYLEELTGQVECADFSVAAKTCEGPVVDTLIEVAEQIESDLIVMSTHGRGGESRSRMIGAVANRVLNTAAIPVILVQGQSLEVAQEYSTRLEEEVSSSSRVAA